jgi:hypothetical protein
MNPSRAYTLLPLLPMSKIRKTPAHQQLRQKHVRAREPWSRRRRQHRPEKSQRVKPQ